MTETGNDPTFPVSRLYQSLQTEGVLDHLRCDRTSVSLGWAVGDGLVHGLSGFRPPCIPLPTLVGRGCPVLLCESTIDPKTGKLGVP